MTSSSSVSSFSIGDSEDNNNNHNNPNSTATPIDKSNNKNDPIYDSKSIFSGFWSDSEIIPENDKDQEKNATATGTCTDHEGFYLTIGNFIYEIGLGDVVAMRNSFETEYPPTSTPMGTNSQEGNNERIQEANISDYSMDAASDKHSDYYENQPYAQTNPNSTPPQSPKVPKLGDGLMLARVERIWQETSASDDEPKILFRARWFLKKEDIDSLPLEELKGPVSGQTFANTITQHDLVLSNQSDDNHVTTICDIIQVLYRSPDLDTQLPVHILPATYLCRYSLSIENHSRVVVLPFAGENDDWREMTTSALTSKKRSVGEPKQSVRTVIGSSPGQLFHNLLTPQQGKRRLEDAPYSAGMTASAQKRRRVGDFTPNNNNNNNNDDDDGTPFQMSIQVGPAHQVVVPKFTHSMTPKQIVSRNPVCMWKPNNITASAQDEYIERAARILTPYLREHHLTQEEPYAPFPTKRMEELSQSLSKQRLATLSSVSSVSSLTTHTVDALREFNVDALLRNLHVSNYNVDIAIAAIAASPMDYVVAWSSHEKARFDAGFRRYLGSLRAIHKGMGDKPLKGVIDYFYRFKIPDQFRKVQERKREQAIRMLECIETKRNLNAPIVVTPGIANASSLNGNISDETRETNDWTQTRSAALAVSIEERRAKAKELLLDVEAKLGRNKMMKTLEVFQYADEMPIAECKIKLLEICKGHKDFQSRFLEFLPQELRL